MTVPYGNYVLVQTYIILYFIQFSTILIFENILCRIIIRYSTYVILYIYILIIIYIKLKNNSIYIYKSIYKIYIYHIKYFKLLYIRYIHDSIPRKVIHSTIERTRTIATTMYTRIYPGQVSRLTA